ncbi:MAG TPA: serine/threonine-protein kinase [Polyangiaceae bacterium]|nr:serine/threonine-protein kinase [Polyangiaceae bacterium]
MSAPHLAAGPPGLPRKRLGTLDGKYTLVKELGVGATGTVYEGEHVVVGKRVAIKVLHTHCAADDLIRARFEDEARAAARIGHDNVVDTFDFGVTADGAPYLVMELLQGETLEELVRRRGALPPTFACELMMQLLAGLGAAHALGIVHRDLKPANVIVTHPRPDEPLVKLLDFGVASGVRSRKDEGIFGTPIYMSPEQALGKAVDSRADIYAAGAILYEMLSGEQPFAGTLQSVLRDVAAGNFRPLASVNPAVPRALVAAVAAAMATDPEQRLRSAHEFATRLSPYVSHAPPRSVPDGPRSADAFLLRDGTPSEVAFFSEPPEFSRPSRDFPARDLARVAGKPNGDPLADSLLQSPIIPRAPAAPKIQLFGSTRDVERWSAPPPVTEPPPSLTDGSAEGERSRDSLLYSDDQDDDPAGDPGGEAWHRAAWVTMLGVGVGAILAWLCHTV